MKHYVEARALLRGKPTSMVYADGKMWIKFVMAVIGYNGNYVDYSPGRWSAATFKVG
ncbi:MAG TPA: hypothetical protein VKU80_12045 [Planctomycetota bacterium]|nr:hypothetical protein [Planctomycetota bacterium]